MTLALCALASACGHPDPAAPDAAAATPDAAPTHGPWSSPRMVIDGNAGFWCDAMSVTGDGLTMYATCGPYASPSPTGFDITVRHRATTADPWPAETQVAELSTGAYDDGPCVAPDDRTIWFATKAQGRTDDDVFVSTRADPSQPWGPPVSVAEVSLTTTSELKVKVTSSGLAMTLERVPPGGNLGSASLYTSQRTDGNASWSTPVALTAAAGGIGLDPVLSADQLELLFVQRGCPAGFCLYTATRATTADPFGTAVPNDELNALGGIRYPWLSPDGHTLYFGVALDASTPDSGYRIYEATR